MAQLQQHRTDELRTATDENGAGFPNPEPGEYVYHSDDKKSFGLVVSRVGDECNVIWSKQPNLIPNVKVQSQIINATSRKLKATWSVSTQPTHYDGITLCDGAILNRPNWEVEEEYESLNFAEVQHFHEQGATIKLHQGSPRVTVRRKADRQPDAESADVRVIRRNVWNYPY